MINNRAELNNIERTVIRERFALDATTLPAKPKTLEQVGAMIGVTKERVRQIQNKALQKIRQVMEDGVLRTRTKVLVEPAAAEEVVAA